MRTEQQVIPDVDVPRNKKMTFWQYFIDLVFSDRYS